MNISVFTPFLKYMHGVYNAVVLLFFLYQAALGLKIRKKRLAEGSTSSDLSRKHRTLGPVLAFLGIPGFFAGMTIVYIAEGKIFAHPPNFIAGMLIALCILASVFASRKISVRKPVWRDRHFILGIILILLYLVQAFLGTRMLLESEEITSFLS